MRDSDKPLTRESLLLQIDTVWRERQIYLASLTEVQLTQLTDNGGWTVKDHVIHLATWEQGTLAALEKQSMREAMAIDVEPWGDDDPVNAIIHQRYRTMPLNEVMQTLQQTHQRFLAKLETLTEEDLTLPYSHYQPESTSQHTMLEHVQWDIVYHYRDHTAWIRAIVGAQHPA